jgi:hypothetical protein
MRARRTEGRKRAGRYPYWRLILPCIALLAQACAPPQAEEVPSRMVDNGDGTVTDTETGLMWMKNANNGRMTWDEAMSWAQNLLLAGYDDWRLPSGLNRGDDQVCNSQPAGVNCPDTEFGTLYFGYGISDLLNSGVFEDVVQSVYWTSTEFPSDTSEAMSQDMNDGGQNPFPKEQALLVWAVRTTSPTDQPALIDNGDGTVVDTTRCLMWTKDANLPCTLGLPVTPMGVCWFHSLAAAEEWAANLEYAGYDDWRLSSELDPSPPNSELEYLFYRILANPPGGPIVITGPFDNVLQSTDFTFYDDNGERVDIQRVHDDYWTSIFPGSPVGREPSFRISDQSYRDWFMTDGETLSAWAVRDACDTTPP